MDKRVSEPVFLTPPAPSRCSRHSMRRSRLMWCINASHYIPPNSKTLHSMITPPPLIALNWTRRTCRPSGKTRPYSTQFHGYPILDKGPGSYKRLLQCALRAWSITYRAVSYAHAHGCPVVVGSPSGLSVDVSDPRFFNLNQPQINPRYLKSMPIHITHASPVVNVHQHIPTQTRQSILRTETPSQRKETAALAHILLILVAMHASDLRRPVPSLPAQFLPRRPRPQKKTNSWFLRGSNSRPWRYSY
jgi:hypothetical protein